MRRWLLAVWLFVTIPTYPVLAQSLHPVDEQRLQTVSTADFEGLSRQHALCHLYVLYQSVVTLEVAGCREIEGRPIKVVRLDLMQRVINELQRRHEQRLYSDDQCHYEFRLASGDTEVGIISLRSAYEIESAIENVQAALDLRAMLSSGQRIVYDPPASRQSAHARSSTRKIPVLAAPRIRKSSPPRRSPTVIPKDDEVFVIDDVIPFDPSTPAPRASH